MNSTRAKILAGVVLTLTITTTAAAQFKPIRKPIAGPPPGTMSLSPILPGPAPTGISVTGVGITATASWQAVAGAGSYSVTRWLQSDPNCCRVSSPTLNAPTWTDTGLQWPGTYVYHVGVSYSDGRIGTADYLFTRPTPQDPSSSSFSAAQVGEGQVKLSWQPVAGVTTYFVGGPGAGPNGTQVTANSVTLNSVPAGTQQWTVASLYAPGGLLTPGASWPKTSLTVRSSTGTYRVVLEGIRVDQPTAEDALIWDGRGDEVYITTEVVTFQPNGGMISSAMLRTPVFGDTYRYPDRVMAGTASNAGGLVKGNSYPAPVQYTSQLQPPTTTRLPFAVWQGTLSDAGDWVAFSPAIWEQDGNERVLNTFTQNYQQTAGVLSHSSDIKIGMAVGSWRPTKCKDITPVRWAPVYGQNGPADVPVDINQILNSWCPTWVALNRRTFDSLLPGGQPGIYEIEFSHYTSDTNYVKYMLFVRLEKLQ